MENFLNRINFPHILGLHTADQSMQALSWDACLAPHVGKFLEVDGQEVNETVFQLLIFGASRNDYP